MSRRPAKTTIRSGIALIVVFMTGCGASARDGGRGGEGDDVLPRGVLIAHALGELDGNIYTNSLAAAEHNYALGSRWFEVDLTLTADRDLVTFHEDLESKVGLDRRVSTLRTGEVLAHRFAGRFPITTFGTLLRRFADVADADLVIDTKRWSPEILAAVLHGLDEVPVMGARVVPQIYHRSDLALLRSVRDRWPYPTLIFTLYQTDLPDDGVLAFVKATGIRVVAMPTTRFSAPFAARLHRAAVTVLVHTIDDHDEAERLAADGADGFYTDSLRADAGVFRARTR